MQVKCYSVRVSSMCLISPKAYKVTSFDGSEDIIPVSCVYGNDFDVVKSDAYWIAAWILPKKKIQYSTKKEAWYDTDKKRIMPSYKIEKHVPETISPVGDNGIDNLKRNG